MADPLVSIIIPCYNGATFISEAVESGLNQTYPHKEVIVVDDGSTDDSLKVLEALGSSVTVLSGENGGVASARNKGAVAARGELLQFLDQDDLLYPHKLERQVPLAMAHRPGLVFCDAEVTDYDTCRLRGTWGTGFVSTEDPVIHVLGTVLQTSGGLHWRESFENVGGFRADAPPCEDRDLHMRLACAGVSFHHLPERLYVWRQVAGSQSKKNSNTVMYRQTEIVETAYQTLDSDGHVTAARREAFAGFFARTARKSLRLGLASLAQECFQRAREIHPDGGFSQAYSPSLKMMARLLGPRFTEQVVCWKRTVFRNQEIASTM